MKRRDSNLIGLALAVIAAFAMLFGVIDHPTTAQQPARTTYGTFAGAFAVPYLSGVGSATLSYSAGTVYVGGASHAITAGTVTSLGATKNDCAAPLFASCEIIYWTSSTGLTHSTSITTAYNNGNNSIVGYVTTDGSSKVATIKPASLMLSSYPPPVAYSCGTSSSCASVAAVAPLHQVMGQIAFSSSTTANVSGISPAFTAVGTYACAVTNANGHAYTSGAEATSSSAFTVVSGTSNSDTWTYVCTGY